MVDTQGRQAEDKLHVAWLPGDFQDLVSVIRGCVGDNDLPETHSEVCLWTLGLYSWRGVFAERRVSQIICVIPAAFGFHVAGADISDEDDRPDHGYSRHSMGEPTNMR